MYRDQGQFERAEETFGLLLPLLEARGDESRALAYLLAQWGLLHSMAGRPNEAEPLFRRSLPRGAPWITDPEFAPALDVYARLLRDSDRGLEAEALLNRDP